MQVKVALSVGLPRSNSWHAPSVLSVGSSAKLSNAIHNIVRAPRLTLD